MTKHKKRSVHDLPWSEWIDRELPPPLGLGGGDQIRQVSNNRYDVGVYRGGEPDGPLGQWIHLSIKDHDRSARHDWRDLQRIKNELVGPECDAIEIYPAESRLVDAANQYHLFVFLEAKIPLGFTERFVAEGTSTRLPKAQQRPFELRPADCLTGAEYDAYVDARLPANFQDPT